MFFIKRLLCCVVVAVLLSTVLTGQASAVEDAFIGEIRMFAGNFAPTGWAFCDGQLLPLSGNTVLFSLLGTMYGGNGSSNFALPDLRGRVPIGGGHGQGLSLHYYGESGGEATIVLLESEIPAHSHVYHVSTGLATSATPGEGLMPATVQPINRKEFYIYNNSSSIGGGVATAVIGGGSAHDNMQPYVAVSYIICLQGIFPPRD